MKKTFVAALTALAIVGTVATTTTQANANPLEAGAAIVGGALYAGATVVGAAGAVVAAPFAGPYYYAGLPLVPLRSALRLLGQLRPHRPRLRPQLLLRVCDRGSRHPPYPAPIWQTRSGCPPGRVTLL